jgi:hypothetical protein
MGSLPNALEDTLAAAFTEAQAVDANKSKAIDKAKSATRKALSTIIKVAIVLRVRPGRSSFG